MFNDNELPRIDNKICQSHIYRIEDLERLCSEKSTSKLKIPNHPPSCNLSFIDSFKRGFESSVELGTIDKVSLERKKGTNEFREMLLKDEGLRQQLLEAIGDKEILDKNTEELVRSYGFLSGRFLYEFNHYKNHQKKEIIKDSVEWGYEFSIPAINDRGEFEDFFKYVSAQRWMKKEMGVLIKGGSDFTGKEGITDQINDENFGKVIDRIVQGIDNSQSVQWFFTDLLARSLSTVHFDSEVYHIHSDSAPETTTKLESLRKKYGNLFPLPQYPYTWKVINTNFLMGDMFFWSHLKEKHPEIFDGVKKNMQQILRPGTKHFSSGHHPVMDGGEAMEAEIENRIDFNALMSEYCPDILTLLKIPIQKGVVINTQHAFIDYNYYFTFKPKEALKLLLGEKVV